MDERRLSVTNNVGGRTTTTTDPNFYFTSGLLSAADACLSRFPGIPPIDYSGAMASRLLPTPLASPHHLMSPGTSWSPAKPPQLHPHHYRVDPNPQVLLNHFGSTQAFLQTLWANPNMANGANYNHLQTPLKPPETVCSTQFLGDGRTFFPQSSQLQHGGLTAASVQNHLDASQQQYVQLGQSQQQQHKIMGDMSRLPTELSSTSSSATNVDVRSMPQSCERSPLVRSANSQSSSSVASPLNMRSSSGTPAALNQSNESVSNHQYHNYQSPHGNSQQSSPATARTHSSMSNAEQSETGKSGCNAGGFNPLAQFQPNSVGNGPPSSMMFSPQLNQRSQQHPAQNFPSSSSSGGFYSFKNQNDLGHSHQHQVGVIQPPQHQPNSMGLSQNSSNGQQQHQQSFNSFFNSNVDPSLSTLVDEAISALTGKDASLASLDVPTGQRAPLPHLDLSDGTDKDTSLSDLGNSFNFFGELDETDNLSLVLNDALGDSNSLIHSALEFDLGPAQHPSTSSQISPGNNGGQRSGSANHVTPKLREKIKRKEREIAEIDRELQRHLNLVAERDGPNNQQSTARPDCFSSSLTGSSGFLMSPTSESQHQSMLSPFGMDKPSTSDQSTFKTAADNSGFASESSVRFSPVRFSPLSDNESDDESTSQTSTPAISRFSCFKQKPEDAGTKIFIPIPDADPSTSLTVNTKDKSTKADTNTRAKRVPIYKQMSQMETTRSYLSPKKSQVLTLNSPGTPSSKNPKNRGGGDSPYSFTDDEDTTSVAEILKEKSLEEEVSKKLAEISSVHPELKIAVLKQKCGSAAMIGGSRSSTPFGSYDRSHSVMSTDSRAGGRSRLDSQLSCGSGYGRSQPQPQLMKSPSKGAVKMFNSNSPIKPPPMVTASMPVCKTELPVVNTVEMANEMWRHIVPKKRHSAAGMTNNSNGGGDIKPPPPYNNVFCPTMAVPHNVPNFDTPSPFLLHPRPFQPVIISPIERGVHQPTTDYNSIDSAITSVLSRTVGTASEEVPLPATVLMGSRMSSNVSNSVNDAVSSVLQNVLGNSQPSTSYPVETKSLAPAALVPRAHCPADLSLISESPTSPAHWKPIQLSAVGDSQMSMSQVHNEAEAEAELSVEAQIRNLLRGANEEKLQRRLDFMGSEPMDLHKSPGVPPLPVFGATKEPPVVPTVSSIPEPPKPTLLLRISKQVLNLIPSEEPTEDEEHHQRRKKKKKHRHKHKRRRRCSSSDSDQSDLNPFAGRLIVIENDFGGEELKPNELDGEEQQRVESKARKERKKKRRKHHHSANLTPVDDNTQSAPETDLFSGQVQDEQILSDGFEGFCEEDLLVAGLPPSFINWGEDNTAAEAEVSSSEPAKIEAQLQEIIQTPVEPAADSDEDLDDRKLEIDETDTPLMVENKSDLVEGKVISVDEVEDEKKTDANVNGGCVNPKKIRLLGTENLSQMEEAAEMTQQCESVANESRLETLHEADLQPTNMDSINMITESTEISDRPASHHSFVTTSFNGGCEEQMLMKGSFIVAQDDLTINDCPLWRVDNQNLLQKFVPVERNGITVYQSTATYSGWCNEQAYRYMSVSVRFLEQSKNHALVQLETPLEDLIPAISTEISDSVEACGLSPPECDQNGETRGTPPPDQPLRNALDAYLHALVLHAISGNFLQRISVEWEFTRHIEEVESMNLEKKSKLLSSVVWQSLFKDNIEWYPFLSVSETDSSGLLCQACNGRYVEASVQLYGDPYNLETLKPRPHKSSTSGSPIPSQEFHCCSVCSDLAESYHRLNHMKYSLFRKCEDKVELIVEEAGKNLEPSMVTEQCLRNRTWVHSVVQEYIDQWQRIC